MSFDNYYPNRKDRRTPYRKPKSFDATCRNHGSDEFATTTRLYHHNLTEQSSLAELHAYIKGLYSVPLYTPADEHEYNYFNSHITRYTPY